MNKKVIIAFLIVIVLTLSCFCGCSKEEGTAETASSAAEITDTLESDVTTAQQASEAVNSDEKDNNNKSDETETKPEYTRDENEVEILTVPQVDSENKEATSPKVENDSDFPELEDILPSGEEIELPFVPIN